MKKLPQSFIDKLQSVIRKRPATVIRHILQHGYITTEELKNIYGYNHPPRAIRDVREQGIPVETYRIKGEDGRTIAAYRFGNPDDVDKPVTKAAGRTVLSKALKRALIDKYGAKCFIYSEPLDESLLQVDHRIPYEIAGEQSEHDTDVYMLLSPSANRAKSWACEHCLNWERRDASFCISCFWAYPEHYTNIAGRHLRRIVLTFTGDEIADYDRLIALVGEDKAQQTIKDLIHDYLE